MNVFFCAEFHSGFLLYWMLQDSMEERQGVVSVFPNHSLTASLPASKVPAGGALKSVFRHDVVKE